MDRSQKFIIGIIVIFIVGIFIGMGLKGDSKDETPDIKKILGERTALQTQLGKVQSDNRGLQRMLSQLQSEKSEEGALKVLREQYEGTFFDLEKANIDLNIKLNAARKEIKKAHDETNKLRANAARAHAKSDTGTAQSEVIEKLKSRIAGLEKENRDLESIIDSINTMLKGRDTAPGPKM